MRSIRRSLLGYFLLLLALAFGAVVLLVDRFAQAAMKTREEAEADRIGRSYQLRHDEAQKKFDKELVRETHAFMTGAQSTWAHVPGFASIGRGRPRSEPRGKSEGGPKGPPPPSSKSRPAPRPPGEEKLPIAPPPRAVSLTYRPGGMPKAPPGLPPPRRPRPSFKASESDLAEYRKRITALLFSRPGDWTTTLMWYGFQRNAGVAWQAFEGPRAVASLQLPEVLRQAYIENEDHPGLYQFNILAFWPGQHSRVVGLVRPNRLGRDLPFDPSLFERPRTEFVVDDIELPEIGPCRRVVMGGNWPFGNWLQAPIPATSPSPNGGFRRWDFGARLFVHLLRPHSELEARLAADIQERDRQLANVREGTRRELTQLRTRLGLIGLGSFAALALGGWLIVARGLSPIHKLSVAVSRVSERDFRLPVERDDLSRELTPILDRLTQTFELLQKAFAREKQAVGDISHELRTPIASLLATIDVSLRKPRTADQYRTTLEDCLGIARQLGQLVERIMTLATLDAGNSRTRFASVPAAELAAGCAAIIRPLAEAHHLAFSLHADDQAHLETDPDMLREVLMNLLHNAVEYNQPGGRVELSVRREGPSVIFEIRDTGIGMSPEIREKIFERFFRADFSRHATGVHAGLGLAIVKEYVDRLGGTITVQSELEVGSTFRVALPASASMEPEEGPAAFEESLPRHRGQTAPAGS